MKTVKEAYQEKLASLKDEKRMFKNHIKIGILKSTNFAVKLHMKTLDAAILYYHNRIAGKVI